MQRPPISQITRSPIPQAVDITEVFGTRYLQALAEIPLICLQSSATPKVCRPIDNKYVWLRDVELRFAVAVLHRDSGVHNFRFGCSPTSEANIAGFRRQNPGSTNQIRMKAVKSANASRGPPRGVVGGRHISKFGFRLYRGVCRLQHAIFWWNRIESPILCQYCVG
ncbi:MAG: hypothetical protein CM1200mP24_08570 [Gammaproteobacteria bacterium]|nr:MAG: hypothetical protein CM1200mP24_08570 [Gammaproteobacteria bacterium]